MEAAVVVVFSAVGGVGGDGPGCGTGRGDVADVQVGGGEVAVDGVAHVGDVGPNHYLASGGVDGFGGELGSVGHLHVHGDRDGKVSTSHVAIRIGGDDGGSAGG